AGRHRVLPLQRDALVRARVDQEAVPALVLRLEAAAVLPVADDQRAQVPDQGAGRVGVADLALARRIQRLIRIPREEALVVPGRDGAGRARVLAGHEVAVVLVGGARRAVRTDVGGLVRAPVGAEAAEARAEHADVHVAHGRDDPRRTGGAGARRGWLHGRRHGVARGVDA